MSIAIFAQPHSQIDEVVAALRRDGVDIFPIKLNAISSSIASTSNIKKAVLVMQEAGISTIGHKTALVRSLLPPEVPILLCIPQSTVAELQSILDCGAAKIVTPRSWAPDHIAERIMAEFILEGYVQPSSYGGLKGATREIRQLYSDIETLAGLNDPVLILGETGTGKELIARELHTRSHRPEPFLKLNCAELLPELLRSELFGHAKGSFTSAHQAKIGLMATAGKGTLFLDEIGELDSQAQAMLLQALEDRKFRPLGSIQLQDLNARLVFATHRNLKRLVDEGRFRRDLFARIGGLRLYAPPLRERLADIPLLAYHFVEEFNAEYPSRKVMIPFGAIDCLFQSEWPENVRQLRNIVRIAATFRDVSGYLSSAHLQNEVHSRRASQPQDAAGDIWRGVFDPANDTWRDVLNRVQQAYFRAVLSETRGNKEIAAKLAGLSRSQFYEKLKEIEQRGKTDGE